MILTDFPYTTRRSSNVGTSYFGRQNVIVYARTRDISFSEHTAPLSIKTTLKGRELYEVEKVPVVVDEDSYLILNNDQPYASEICSHTEVESFCVFFRHDMAKDALATATSHIEHLLDDPSINNGQDVSFFQKLNRHDRIISPMLDALRTGITEGSASQMWIDEQFHGLMQGLLRIHVLAYKEIDSISAARRATRIELYRRLCKARDYIDSCYYDRLTLTTLANVACLSEHHFLRSFKQVFHITPHQYLMEKRLEKARAILLKEADRSVLDVCICVGFENPSSFTRLFKRRFGYCPQQSRNHGD